MTNALSVHPRSGHLPPASGAEALALFAPEVADYLTRLVCMVPLGPRDEPLTGAARSAVSRITGLEPLPGSIDLIEPEQSPVVEAAVEVAEQLALDVSGVTDEQRAVLTDMLGRAAHGYLLSVYLADWIPRVRHALDALFGPGDWADPEPDGDASRLWGDFAAMIEAIGRLQTLDPLTTEYVRLRMARQHGCALCKSLRNRSALESGGSESAYSHLDDWQHSTAFDERQRAALALTDLLIWQPTGLDAESVRRIRAEFTAAEQVELVLDMLRNAANKVAIASATDGAHVEEGVEIYDVTDTGETVFGLGFVPAP